MFLADLVLVPVGHVAQQLEYRNQSLASIQAQKMKVMPTAAGGRIHEGKALSVLVI